VPEVPVIVTGYVPAATEAPTVNVTLLAALVEAVLGLNAAVTPEGSPDTIKLTVPVNPFWPLTLRVLLPLPACGTVRLTGEALRLKLGTSTVSDTEVWLLSVPEVPVIVTG
jgi:hypothetical protein